MGSNRHRGGPKTSCPVLRSSIGTGLRLVSPRGFLPGLGVREFRRILLREKYGFVAGVRGREAEPG